MCIESGLLGNPGFVVGDLFTEPFVLVELL
jgi:hypothetical protein